MQNVTRYIIRKQNGRIIEFSDKSKSQKRKKAIWKISNEDLLNYKTIYHYKLRFSALIGGRGVIYNRSKKTIFIWTWSPSTVNPHLPEGKRIYKYPEGRFFVNKEDFSFWYKKLAIYQSTSEQLEYANRYLRDYPTNTREDFININNK